MKTATPFTRLLSYALVVLAAGCITEYQPTVKSIPRALVVEGSITDQPGPYSVKLTQTTEYTQAGLNLLTTGAQVIISDDLGHTETLAETSAGVYQTQANGLQGVAGRSYTLTIVTQDGKRYVSSPEILTAAPPIGKLYYEYREDPTALTNDKIQGWDVYVDLQDPATPGDFYRWDWAHYEPIEVCQINQQPDGSTIGLPCCTLPCWDITRCYTCINIKSDAVINGNALTRQLIARVPFTSTSRYFIDVQQQRLSAGASAFWQSVRGLVQNTGGLFDAAPATIAGNLHCTSDSTQQVYGYFGATGIAEASLYVDRSEASGSPVATPGPTSIAIQGCAVCQNSLYRTPNPPPGWQF